MLLPMFFSRLPSGSSGNWNWRAKMPAASPYQYVAKAMAKIYESLGYCTSAALRTTACHAKPVIGRFEMEQIRRCD
jgi:hypothetical protein